MKMDFRILISGLLFLILGCASARISINDKEIFMESPKIVVKEDRYFLKFRYAESPKFVFYAMTWSKIQGNKLIFYMPCTSSSGNLRGVVQYEEIVSPDKIDLIKKQSVYWENPENKLIKLVVGEMEESLDVIKSRIRTH
ncbi:MAG: hypothetical protein PF689_07365 [Deltaproteobacteria bacterium]|jgi:hypothetical protein|nr:hypothetical protein [Deltaproteobacteria bacterium]